MSEEKVVSLAAVRQEKIDNPKEGDRPLPGYEQVRLIACIGCGNSLFNLVHDHRIVCATCHVIIEPLNWLDVNFPPPPNGDKNGPKQTG